MVQLNEQSMSLKVSNLNPGDARAVYRNTQLDLRNYKRLQMWNHAEAFIDNTTDLRSGDLSLIVRLGSDVKNNFYEYEIPLELTPPGNYNTYLESDRYIVWPERNFLDLNLQALVDLKKERNRAKRDEQSGVGFATLYTGRDPDNERNRMAVLGNPSLSDVRVILIGVRNNSSTAKSGTVWVNELKVTDFNEEGGYAAKANATLSISDIATLNMGAHIESSGFGGVDQSLNERRLDDYHQYNFAVQADLGRFLPEKAKLRAPIYYSYSTEKTTPKYNPLDQDVRLSDALDDCETKHERDSILAYAEERTTVRNFSISGLNFGVKSKNPMPWDPANFTINFSFNKTTKKDPTTEYEYTNDYRGSLQYSYSPYFKPFKPFKNIKSKSKNARFLRDWELNWLPTSIAFNTNMSRYYYEQQTRSEIDQMFQLPVSVSKNFLWDRQLNLNWNITKTLSLTFNSNTSARIEETVGAVNRRLFPDKYREWSDTVWNSILSMGTPWSYNQTFTGQYKAPFSKIPFLDMLNGSVTYNATYRWDRGAEVDGVRLGNTIANQSSWTADGRLNFETFYNKIPLLKSVNTRFANKRPSTTRQRKAKKFERTYALKPDTSIVIKHNLRTQKVRVSATTTDGKPFTIKTRVVDQNSVEVLTRADGRNIKFTVTEILKEEKSLWRNVGEYALRLAMSPRNFSVRYRNTRSLSLPLFTPDIGNVFGQSLSYGPMAPGLDFAFGFAGREYIDKALDRNWLITDDGQTSPALWSNGKELNIEATIEPFKGFKVQLTMNRTDNRTQQVQFMYADMPVTYSGSYTKTHMAIATALASSKASDGYASKAFDRFLEYIPQVRDRVEAQYAGITYPDAGFLRGTAQAGAQFSPETGAVSPTSGDVLIPAFIAAYSGRKASDIYLTAFPSFAAVLPNWRVTYDGFINLGRMRDIFKTFTVTHAYQCTYSVGSYSSYLNWVSADGERLGFTLDELTGRPIPSSPYNISSVAITERFAPLIGVNATLKNDLRVNVEYKDQRTLTLNTSAGQVVEATTSGLTVGVGYKIVGFNTVLKMKGTQTGVSNDLTMNADVSYNHNTALIRRIESNYAQPTSGTNSWRINFTANYVLSRRVTLAAYFEHQINNPIITTSSYPTTNTSYGVSLNLSLAR